MEVDHIVPRAAGDTDDPSNLQLLCSDCNRRKGTKSQAEAAAAQIAELQARIVELEALNGR